MNRLPIYVLVEDDSLNGGMIMQTIPPYIVAKPYKVDKRDREKLIECADKMREGVIPMVKVEGFTVFLTRWTTLEGDRVDYATTKRVLSEMADYYLNHKILKGRHPFKACDEERDEEWYRQRAEDSKKFKALKEARRNNG